MARRPRLSPAEQLLLDVCRAVDACHGGLPLRWVGIDTVHARLPKLTLEQLDAVIAVAVDRSWLQAGGRPAHHVMLTLQGRAAIAG